MANLMAYISEHVIHLLPGAKNLTLPSPVGGTERAIIRGAGEGPDEAAGQGGGPRPAPGGATLQGHPETSKVLRG